MTFRNTATSKINEKMGTMRNQAKKLANEYAWSRILKNLNNILLDFNH